MTGKSSINGERFLSRLNELGQTGREAGRLTRLAASDTDKASRDAVVAWMKDAGLEIKIDRIGNILGIWSSPYNNDQARVMLGSHIDTVINAGIYDGAAKERGLQSKRMTSGAGQDAQMMARICPTAMIFVPSVDGISHNPKEFTAGPDLVAGANVLMDVVVKLTEAK
ncbi:MAG: M20/M25/M40 family metallo-hydrolase [Pseudomonadota bacterium]